MAPAPRSFRLKPRLKEAREKLGLTQAALGRLMLARSVTGFRPNHVGLFELGYRDATWAEVEALADLLRVDATWLANQSDPPASAASPRASAATVPATASNPPPAAQPPPAPRGLAHARAAAPSAAVEAPSPERLPPGVPPRGGEVDLVYRERLAGLLADARQTLLDRTLKPAEWRAWRSYSEALRSALQALA